MDKFQPTPASPQQAKVAQNQAKASSFASSTSNSENSKLFNSSASNLVQSNSSNSANNISNEANNLGQVQNILEVLLKAQQQKQQQQQQMRQPSPPPSNNPQISNNSSNLANLLLNWQTISSLLPPQQQSQQQAQPNLSQQSSSSTNPSPILPFVQNSLLKTNPLLAYLNQITLAAGMPAQALPSVGVDPSLEAVLALQQQQQQNHAINLSKQQATRELREEPNATDEPLDLSNRKSVDSKDKNHTVNSIYAALFGRNNLIEQDDNKNGLCIENDNEISNKNGLRKLNMALNSSSNRINDFFSNEVKLNKMNNEINSFNESSGLDLKRKTKYLF